MGVPWSRLGVGTRRKKGANVMRVERWQTAVRQVDLEWSDDSLYKCSRCGAIWHPIASLESRVSSVADIPMREVPFPLAPLHPYA